jgi:glutamate dehydrogenase/leucine dehydrogenase
VCRPTEYPCEVCSVVASSEEQLALHKDGKRHRKHLAMAEVLAGEQQEEQQEAGEKASSTDGSELHCGLCDVTVPSAVHKKIHLR